MGTLRTESQFLEKPMVHRIPTKQTQITTNHDEFLKALELTIKERNIIMFNLFFKHLGTIVWICVVIFPELVSYLRVLRDSAHLVFSGYHIRDSSGTCHSSPALWFSLHRLNHKSQHTVLGHMYVVSYFSLVYFFCINLNGCFVRSVLIVVTHTLCCLVYGVVSSSL